MHTRCNSADLTFERLGGREVVGQLDGGGLGGCCSRWLGMWPPRRRSPSSRPMALRAVLVEYAQGAARTHGCQFRGHHKALMLRPDYKRAIVATAYKLLRVLYVMLRDAQPYRDPEADYEELMGSHNAPHWIRTLQHYGLIDHHRSPTARA